MKRFISLFMSLILLVGMMVAAIPSAQAADANVITKKNPAVVIRTSFATGAYNKGWGGVFQAAPIKDKEGYVLYDVVIWEDRINLYKFPNNLEQNEKKGFNFAKNDLSTAAGQKAYIKWRESFCLKSVSCKNTADISKSSSTMKEAYISFFKIVKKRSPSTNVILKYSGHGNIGFCGCMNVEDTKATLSKGVSIFSCKFALIDFGTNCQTSTTDFCNVYYPFTNYMLTSQFNYGGYGMDEWNSENYNKTSVDNQYHAMFKVGKSVRVAGENIVTMSTKFWKYCKKNLIAGKIKQSMTLLDMREYAGFATEYAKVHKKYPYNYGTDLYTMVSKYGSAKLKNLYDDFVIYYKDNNNKTNYFKWDTRSYGVTVYNIMPTVKITGSSYVYNGKVQKPTVTVTSADGRKLVKGSDYTVSYSSGCKNVGNYTVKVTVKGTLGSTVSKTFTIKPQATAVKKTTPAKTAAKIHWTKRTTQVTGYQIRYSRSSSFSDAKNVWVKDKASSSTIVKGLKSGKTYYVKIRTYKQIDGVKYYSAWSNAVKFKTK